MGHVHNVIDTDIHYKIDGISRTIVNVNETKRQLVQYDHNSERLTFEIPRKVDGHDFSECNMVEVHFENVDVFEKNKSSGIYIVDDLHVKEDDEETVVLSWLVSGDATKYVGTLNFVIRFACVTDGYVDYAWNTTVFKGISILSGLYNSDFIVREQYDIIAKIQSDLKELKENGMDAEMSADSEFSLESENPVQNKVVTAKFNGLSKEIDDQQTQINLKQPKGNYALKEEIPTRLPNPQKLTFKLGGTTYEYDGNSAVSITIEDASEVAY